MRAPLRVAQPSCTRLAANGVYRKLWDDQGHTRHNAAGQADDDDDEDDDDEE